MTHAFLRRSLLGLALVLLCYVPLTLRPTAAWSAATSSETSGKVPVQSPQAAAMGWASWQNLGDLNGYAVNDPVFGHNQDGHLEIMAWGHYTSALSDYAVYRRNQTAVNGTSWTGWSTLGTLEASTAAPAVATNPQGRMEVVSVGEVAPAATCTYRTAIKQIAQTAPNGGWGGWWNMGQSPTACYLYSPYFGTNSDGRLDVYALGSDGYFYHRFQIAPSGGWTPNWTSLGNPISGQTPWPQVAVGNNADGRIALFVTSPNASGQREVYHIWQNTASNLSSWSSWVGFGNPGVELYSPVVERNSDGRLDVFAPGTDGNLYHKWQVAPNSYWSSDWESLGQPGIANYVHDPKAIRMQDGRLAVFTVADDGAIWWIAQTQASGYWGTWTPLSMPPGVVSFGDLAIGKNQNGSLVIAATGFYSGGLWVTYEQHKVLLPLLKK